MDRFALTLALALACHTFASPALAQGQDGLAQKLANVPRGSRTSELPELPALPSDALWETGPDEWDAGRHDGTVTQDGRLTLAPGVDHGSWTRRLSGEPADRFLLSLNPEPFPPGSRVRARVRVRLQDDRTWSPWLPLGIYGSAPDLPASERSETWRGVSVLTDVIRSKGAPVVEAEVRLELQRGSGAPQLRRVSVDRWRGRPDPQPPATRSRAWGIELAGVPQRSQRVEPPSVRGRICSPTSLGMVLGFHGRDLSTQQVAQSVYDHGSDAYGNWSFNAAFAGVLGLEASARHFSGLAQIEEEIVAGRPVVLSHRFEPGELENAPIKGSKGHLIVVVGFTHEGDVIVHDPAATPADGIRRVYRRRQLEHTWLQRGEGVVYVVR